MKPTKARAARRGELDWKRISTADDVRKALREECDYEGGIRAFSRLAAVTAGHISRVLRGEKEPGPKLLDWFGLRAVTLYERTESHTESGE